MSSVDAREVSYARVCLILRPFRLFQPGDRYVYVVPGQDVGVPVLIQRAERGRPPQTDEEHVWLPPLEHWCAALAGQVRAGASRTLRGWELEQQVLRAIAERCQDYPNVNAVEVAARLYAGRAGSAVPPVVQTLPRVGASEWRR